MDVTICRFLVREPKIQNHFSHRFVEQNQIIINRCEFSQSPQTRYGY